MNRKRTKQLLLAILAAGGATAASANPFQFEAIGGIGKTTVDFDGGGSADLDNKAFAGRYFLQPVDAASGPLAERPFIDKSAYVGVIYSTTEPDFGRDSTATSLEARFVAASDMIFEVLYGTVDFGDSDKTTTTGVGVGKYLDGRTTAVLSYQKADSDFSDVTTISGNFRKLNDGAASGTATAYEFDLAYIDTSNDNGYEFGVSGTYYLSEQLGITADVNHQDIGDFDETDLGISAQFFISEQLFLDAAYSKSSDSDNDESSNMLFGVGGRF